MGDERIKEWAQGMLEGDVRAFERARTRFIRRPTAERLHDVRVSARRLRSLCEDLREALPRLRVKRLARVIDMSGDARDAAVLREALRKALGTTPVHNAAVTATEWSLRGTRRAEEAAESARLKLADVVAEARERIGEEASPPSIGDHDQHEH